MEAKSIRIRVGKGAGRQRRFRQEQEGDESHRRREPRASMWDELRVLSSATRQPNESSKSSRLERLA